MDYLQWNDAIARHFFNTEEAGRRINLYVTPELIEQLGRPEGADMADFVNGVLQGPPWVSRRGLCQNALEAFIDWRQREREYPPYIAHLALFVLAAGLGGDFAPHAYYPRLRTLIREPPEIGQYPYFNRMWLLWDDLEKWSQEDKAGALGVFTVRIAGGHFHVGIPIAQTVITENERRALPSVFADCGFDPTSPPSEEELATEIVKSALHGLRPRTLRLLRSTTSDERDARTLLLEAILDELLEWDGSVEVVAHAAAPEKRRHGVLRLRCVVDRIAGRASAFLHCKTGHPIPEEGLVLSIEGTSERLYCDELANGWCSHLRHESDDRVFDAGQIDWTEGLRLRDEANRWAFALSRARVRIFIDGASLGLRGLVEESRLRVASPFYVAAHPDCADEMREWGASGCKGFREIPIGQGIPRGWHLFFAESVEDDGLVRKHFPNLALPRLVELHFEGGIRAGGASQFFQFAPPRIVLSGGDSAADLYCDHLKLERAGPSAHYTLPDSAPTGRRLVVEARREKEGEPLARRALSLLADFPWPEKEPIVVRGRLGEAYEVDFPAAPCYAGAVALNFEAEFPIGFFSIDLHGYQKAILLGRNPGEVRYYPRQGLPREWAPVWAVLIRKRGLAVYCGRSLENCEPSPESTGNPRMVRRWKEVLWHRRRRIRPPSDPELLALWKRYQERARNA